MSRPSKQHTIVLRVIPDSRRGCRVEYRVVLNGNELYGKVVQTMSKGHEVWKTIWNGQELDHYNPEWLARRNGRIVTLGDNHPSMKQVVARKQSIATPSEADLVPAA